MVEILTKEHANLHTDTWELYNDDIELIEVSIAISKLKAKSVPGPDGIIPAMIINSGCPFRYSSITNRKTEMSLVYIK